MKSRISQALAVLLALVIAGTTDVAQACQTATPAPSQQQTTDQTQQQAQPQSTTPAQQNNAPSASAPKENNASDPTHVPAPIEVLPNAPSASQSTQNTTPAPAATSQTKDQQPLGTAAAEKGQTSGGAASKPAGIAVAGRKQNQSRGLLIKVGAVLAAGAALGTVYALSRGTSPVPPGTVR
jgi:hypothetical protein